jgi:hypothetical protein
VRRTAPEVLLTAKTQRWTPEELLRTLIEAEIAARDASNTANRLKTAALRSPRPSTDRPFGHKIDRGKYHFALRRAGVR